MSIKILTEAAKWQSMKDRYTTGLSGQRASTLNVLLENQRKFLLETASAGATTAGLIATLPKVVMPIIRRVMPGVIANEIVGVQPMTGPVGQVFTLRVQYANNVGTTVAGEEALSPYKIATDYSGDGTNAPAPTASLEGTLGSEINIRTLRETVEAKSRRLSATWTIESMQDAQSQHGIDVEAELMAAISQEMTAQIDQDLLGRIASIAGAGTTFNQSAVSGAPNSVVDQHAALTVLINQQANLIGQETRRGPGNWLVVSPNALTVLQSAGASAFVRTTEASLDAPTNTKLAGTLNGGMKVFVNTYATTDSVLVGLKGSSEADAGFFYCPYIPLMSTGAVMDPRSGEYVVSFLQRAGYLQLSNQATSLGNAAAYYRKINLTNLKFY